MSLKKIWWAAPVIFLLIMGVLVFKPMSVIGTVYSSAAISAVKLSPAFYKSGPVTVAGKVVDYKDHFGMSAYRVADRTGDIMVFFDGKSVPGPSKGSYVVIRGNLQEIMVAGMKMGVFIQEQKRLFSWGGQSKVIINNNSI